MKRKQWQPELTRKYGYPAEGVVYVDIGGGDDYEAPQERWSGQYCGSCRMFDTKDWVCKRSGEDKDPDADTCDDIDFEEKELEELRDPDRREYSSDENYKAACKAINEMRCECERREYDDYHRGYSLYSAGERD